MKTTFILLFTFISLGTSAQADMSKTMDKRAREMHKVISSNNKEDWKKFIQENYTQALINKPMRAQKVTSDQGATSTTDNSSANNLESKVQMFAQLHSDFAGSALSSIVVEGQKVIMTLRNEGMTGIFTLRFEEKSPWLIDGIGVEVEN